MAVSTSDESSQLLFKVLVVGDSGVGKSNIVLRYTNHEFREGARTTIGVEMTSKRVDIEPGVTAQLHIWDTAGQERYESVTKTYYRQASGVLFVYDVTNRVSFGRLKRWMDEVNKYVDDASCVWVLIGNKNDMAHARAVSVEEAAHFAKSHNMSYFETSAKDGSNIEPCFTELVKEMSRRRRSVRDPIAGVSQDAAATRADLPKRSQVIRLEQPSQPAATPTDSGKGKTGCCAKS